jgi:putative flippase GtrA
MQEKPKTITSFFRYNVIAGLATMTDFSIFIILSKKLAVWYVAATFVSAVFGGVVSFVLNRNWAFMSKNGKLSKQAVRYFLVWNGSIFLNTAGLYLIVETTHINEIISKIMVAIIVGVGFNFLMYKYFIFK